MNHIKHSFFFFFLSLVKQDKVNVSYSFNMSLYEAYSHVDKIHPQFYYICTFLTKWCGYLEPAEDDFFFQTARQRVC